MEIKKLILTKNDCYKRGVYIKPTGIMVHSTGANNPKLSRYVGPNDGLLGVNPNNNHWNMSGVGACVHGFIGKLADGSIATYQTLPWNMRGWHCASGKNGSGNDTHISFEICEDGLKDPVYFAEVYKQAVDLCAYLCKEYNISPTKPNLICHSEGHTLGIASNHGDVMHWFPKYGKSMDTLRADVVKKLKELNAPKEEIDVATAAELLGKIEALEKKLAATPAPAKRYQKLGDLPDWAKPAVERRLHLFSNIDPADGQKVLNITEDMFRPWILEDNARSQNIEDVKNKAPYAVQSVQNRIDSKVFSDPQKLDLSIDMIRLMVAEDRRQQELGLLDQNFKPVKQGANKAIATTLAKSGLTPPAPTI